MGKDKIAARELIESIFANRGWTNDQLSAAVTEFAATVRTEERSSAYSAVVNNIAAVLDADDVEVFTALIMKAMRSPDLNSEMRSALKSEAEIRAEEREAAGQIAFAEAVRQGISAERAIAIKTKINRKGEG